MSKSKEGKDFEEAKMSRTHPTFNLRDRQKITEGKKNGNFVFYEKDLTDDDNANDDGNDD